MSQPPASNIISAPPQYQFQQTVTDLSETEGHDILIYTSRYLGWIGVARLGSKVRRMVRQDFLRQFEVFELPEEITSIGGPLFSSNAYDNFLSS